MPSVPITYRPLVGWRGPFTAERRWSPFKASWSDTTDLLDRELFHLGARDVVLQLALRESDIRQDGLPRANARAPEHPGVAIAFGSRYGALWYQTDVFTDWKANLRAIALGLEALRKVDRYGITKRGEQYAGWKALASSSDAGPSTAQEAAEVIRTMGGGTAAEILRDRQQYRASYIRAARAAHPDTGGTTADFQRLQAAKRLLDSHHGVG